MKNHFTLSLLLVQTLCFGQGVVKTMQKLPDTGQTGDYTATFGEDADYVINPPFYVKNANGTVLDTVTGLMWQQSDGGEMTVEKAAIYADTLTLGGFTDWRLPSAHEAYSILNHQRPNPALDITAFASTGAEYWWTSDKQASDATRIWCVNAGGGVGNHPKTETISAGGTKRFHVRAVRDVRPPTTVATQFSDLGNGVVKDNLTGLFWQKTPLNDSLTWEQALVYAENLSLGGFGDWRLPNIKELQSLNDEKLIGPSVSTSYFGTIGVKKYWSSTSLPNQTTRAWYLFTQFGITTYELKTARLAVICVRGNAAATTPTQDVAEWAFSIKIFPNPASENVFFDFSDAQTTDEPIVIRIVNALGQTVFVDKTTSERYALSKAAIGSGLFKAQFQRGQLTHHRWFVFD